MLLDITSPLQLTLSVHLARAQHVCVARQHDVSTSVTLLDSLGRCDVECFDFCANVKLEEQPFCWKSVRALFQVSRKPALDALFLAASLMMRNCKIYFDPRMNLRTIVHGRTCSEVPSSLPLYLQLLRRYTLCPLHR